jgi:hypothetical protein
MREVGVDGGVALASSINRMDTSSGLVRFLTYPRALQQQISDTQT